MSGSPAKIAPSAACEILPWDSQFFGRRIARVQGNRLTAPEGEAVARWCQQESVDCLYLLADADDPETGRVAESLGFRLADVRVEFGLNLATGRRPPAPPPPSAARTRLLESADIDDVERLADGLFRQTRFYADPNFGAPAADRLYRRWIRKSCEGDAQAVWLSESAGKVTGFLSCHLDQARGVGKIGLVGIAPEARGTGTGDLLMNRSLDWFSQEKSRTVEVVTQGRNLRAQRLYQRHGFVTQSVQLWYHWWPQAGKTQAVLPKDSAVLPLPAPLTSVRRK